jgi:hypothetical protein
VAVVGLLAALAAGAGLRLAYGDDIEYKADEAWTFEHSRATALADPWVGMPSSVGLPNPGMSLWVFVLLERASGAADPPALARCVQCLNIAALLLLAWFAWRHVAPPQRELWLWAVALVAVNPLAVLFHRKLWPPCVLPLGTVVFLWAWWYRHHRGAAFVWGLVGICLGQIHMSGFFFAAGFALWTALFGRGGQRPAWGSWLVGTLLGGLPLIPWAFQVMLGHGSTHPPNPGRWKHALEGKFWLRWLTEACGFGADYTLEGHFSDFLAGPRLAGFPTGLTGVLHGVLLVAGLLVLGRAAWHLWRRRGWGLEAGSPTGLALGASFGGFGLLLTLSCVSLHRHYMIVLFPLELVWLAWLALLPPGQRRLGRGLLLSMCLAQLLISVRLLGYIHASTHLHSEYGTPYSAQIAASGGLQK